MEYQNLSDTSESSWRCCQKQTGFCWHRQQVPLPWTPIAAILAVWKKKKIKLTQIVSIWDTLSNPDKDYEERTSLSKIH